jgi:hypothetical protein
LMTELAKCVPVLGVECKFFVELPVIHFILPLLYNGLIRLIISLLYLVCCYFISKQNRVSSILFLNTLSSKPRLLIHRLLVDRHLRLLGLLGAYFQWVGFYRINNPLRLSDEYRGSIMGNVFALCA